MRPGRGVRVAVPRVPGDVDPREGAGRAQAPGPGDPAALVLLVLAGVSLQVELHEHRMHDALLPPLAAFLPFGAWRTRENTSDLHDSRRGRNSPGFAKMAVWTARTCGWRCTR